MKIYWKNIIWNYSVRFWYLLKYKNHKFKKYFSDKRYWNSKQTERMMKRVIAKGLFRCSK